MSVQQRPSTLKAFVRVSKNRDAPVGKDAVKPTMRMTRSKTAALSAVAAAAATATEPPAVSEIALSPTLPKTRSTTRKRKLAPASEATAAEGSPAKRPVRAARSSQRRVDTNSTSKSVTTINTYFSPAKTPSIAGRQSKDAVGATPLPLPEVKSAVEPCPSDVQTASERSKANSLVQDDNEKTVEQAENTTEQILLPIVEDKRTAEKGDPVTAPAESKSDAAADRASLSARANHLLSRLRNRAATSSTDAEPAIEAKNKVDETRAIQENIRSRRHGAQLEDQGSLARSAEHASTTFELAKSGLSDAEASLRRQFVMINSRVGGNTAMPREFKKLEELFQGLEHAVMFNGMCQDGIIYHRVRKSVESMAKRTFGWKELGQILAVYPESYTYSPVMTTHAGRRVQSVVLKPQSQGVNQAIEMEKRRDEFRRRLAERVSNTHAAFLISRGYREAEIKDISGWHPSFDIEAVPSIAPVTLPPPSVSASHGAANGTVATFSKDRLKHLLARNKSDPGAAATDAATSKAAVAEEERKPAVLALLPTPTSSPVIQAQDSLDSSGTLGIGGGKPNEKPTSRAKDLLERIRAKQRAKEAAQAASGPSIPAATRTMYSRLPGMLDMVSYLFYAERKHVLPFYYVVDKLVESKGLDNADLAKHLVALAEFVPEWCSIAQDDQQKPAAAPAASTKKGYEEPQPGARLKVTRNISVQDAKSRLEARLSKTGKA
ncbi:hypothetical protein GGI12_002951 [Dipsacomyces acuminosporus]|nr:hypothetical protein GGI12_002951 [Dipsacomyces acuminosporus]